MQKERSRSGNRYYPPTRGSRHVANDSGLRFSSESSLSDSITQVSYDNTLPSKYYIKKTPNLSSSYHKTSESRKKKRSGYKEPSSAFIGDERGVYDGERMARRCAAAESVVNRSRSISEKTRKLRGTPSFMKNINSCAKERVVMKKRNTEKERRWGNFLLRKKK